MSNVQEALKAAIRFARINPHVGMYENSNSNHVVYGAELAKTFEAALSEIEKCEPVLFAVKDYIDCAKYHNGQTLCALKKTELHSIPLYTSPQHSDWVNKDLLETDDGKWDATLMALWRRLQGRNPNAKFWNVQEIPDDEMFIFRAHFATALLASPLKQLNTKG